jgi:hypothetical protein
MNIGWTLGVLSAGAENVQPLAGGTAVTRAGAAEAASDALVMAAMDRGRQEYRVRVADTLIVVIPGLTERGDVDLLDLAETVPGFEQARRWEPVSRGDVAGCQYPVRRSTRTGETSKN